LLRSVDAEISDRHPVLLRVRMISTTLLSHARCRLGSPVLNLNYLLDTIVQRVKPLDWEVFWAKQASGNVPLKVSGMSVCRAPSGQPEAISSTCFAWKLCAARCLL
jgi:hypothetical protein